MGQHKHVTADYVRHFLTTIPGSLAFHAAGRSDQAGKDLAQALAEEVDALREQALEVARERAALTREQAPR